MGLLAPFVIPGFDRLLVQLILILVAIVGWMLAVTVASIVGIIRAVRRRRRGGNSNGAIVLASVAVATVVMWLLYFVADNLLHRMNPLDSMLAINLSLSVLPLLWLTLAIRTNAAATRGTPLESRCNPKKFLGPGKS